MRCLFPGLSLLAIAVPCAYFLTDFALISSLDSQREGPQAEGSVDKTQQDSMAAAATLLVHRLPSLYLPHGGGPFPVLGEPGHASLTKFMKAWPASIPKPAAILVISAHWEASVARITNASHPELIYDYYGFPPESYSIKYPAPGNPALAGRIAEAVTRAGIDCVLDAKRGYDHGTFIPLKLMYPEAEIPTLQLSLVAGLDPKLHIRMGEALAPFREEGVLVVGSGLSFHNMGAFDFAGKGSPASLSKSKEFDDYLTDAMTNPSYSWEQRAQRLEQWFKGPSARYAHPREEHLLPLMVAFGAGGRSAGPAKVAYHGKLLGTWVSGFTFE